MSDEETGDIMSENTQGTPEKAPNESTGLKRFSKRAKVTVGVVVAVLLVGGFAFNQWHEQPSFCGAICHTPMDMYLINYTDGQYDAYGNEMQSEQESMAMMAYMHKEVNNQTCLQCHVPTIQEQLTEGIHWVTGNYVIAGTNELGYAYMHDLNSEELVKYRGGSGDDFCLRDGCHTDTSGNAINTREQLEAATAHMGVRQPHQFDIYSAPQHGFDLQCTDCHKGHSQSVYYCTQCHTDTPVPDGWLTADQRRQIEVAAFGTA